MRQRKQPTSGFTLVEMMVVIGIIGILAALSAGGYARLSQRAALQNASFEFQSALSGARSRALERGTDVWVIIYPEGGLNSSTNGQGAYFLYEDLTMRFAAGGLTATSFGYDDFSPTNLLNPVQTEGRLLETKYLESYQGGAIRFQRVGTTPFTGAFSTLTPNRCSVCGAGARGALVFSGDGTVRFYDATGTKLDVANASVAIGNPNDFRGFIFGISGATSYVAAQASN